jgi:hypothetical protein
MLRLVAILALCMPPLASAAYPDLWSAASLLGRPVRGVDDAPLGRVEDFLVDDAGNVQDVVVRAGAQSFALPLGELRLAPAPAPVDAPIGRDAMDDYRIASQRALEAELGRRAWRMRSLLADHVHLRDKPDVGFVRDVLFDNAGRVLRVVVANAYESYIYPFFGYDEHVGGYALPYTAKEMDGVTPLAMDMQ